ncbi:MAG: hypothetical protein GF388_01635, partial [Candidatus Aegiribacteria sp.]|nr:hypothetical protein [Candidatus Aegiribacteria sp.]MBD3294075.1 hypothetical protein [Candidatus Fermentibacteria bacterium]
MKVTSAVIGSLLLLVSSVALGDTAMQRILASHEAGEINSDRAAELLVLSAVDYDALPSIYTEDAAMPPSGTPAIMEALRLADAPSLPMASRPPLSGPEYTFDSPDGHFKIHWTDSGADAVTYGYAECIALAADSSWQVQCNELGFIQPPPDNGVGGDDLYDIYICYLTGGTLGYTSPSGEYHPPDSTQNCSASHIVMNSNISGTGQRNCTVSHEFQHAVQMSYDYSATTWFMENCAVWIEEMVYPDIDDYMQYISYGENALRTPWMDIRSAAMYWYGGFPWPWMMWNRWDYTAVREIWEILAETPGTNMLDAHEEMFNDRGTDFESFFMDYGCWRWFTADNWFSGCGMYNEEVSTWQPGPRVLPYHEFSSLPATGDQTAYFEPDVWGIHWIRLDLADYQDNWVQMDFDGRDNFDWNLGVILQSSNSFSFQWYKCDQPTGNKTVAVDPSGWDYVIFFPTIVTDTPLDHLYEFTIEEQT